MIFSFIGGAFATTLHAEHAFELALAEVTQRAANALVDVEGATLAPNGSAGWFSVGMGRPMPGHARVEKWVV